MVSKKIVIFFALLTFFTSAPASAASLKDMDLLAVKEGDVNDQGTAITVRALRDCIFVRKTVDGMEESGDLKFGTDVERRKLHKGETHTFRIMMTESLPSQCVSVEVGADAHLWCPSISGEDGELLMAPGIRTW
ncbi:MAG: hypothetical protein K5657_05520 [Desulfovibrio sp.]|nr:hypothetical protein [Desulfovibrio sp.]